MPQSFHIFFGKGSMLRQVARRIAESIFLALLVAVSLPLLLIRSLRASRTGPPAQPPSPHQFAFHSALSAYEGVIDAAAANSTAARRA
jgi:hypothetical protein